ncbi:MAG: polysaccharide pyruvyl transferase family protein [Anaerolineae bacterium]|nr:polysaccharide pyruvyl transferase family protein [Anaerolineae bacterium]
MTHSNKSTKYHPAIIVPGVTDVNRGDQALVWEAASLAMELEIAEEIYLLDVGESQEELTSQTCQTMKLGYKTLRRILPHPRRGRHRADDKINDSSFSLLAVIFYSLKDWLWGELFLLLTPFPNLAKLFLGKDEYKTYLIFRAAKVMIVKGGGFLHSYGGIRSVYYIWYQLFYFRLAHRLNCPVIVLPNSFGPFEGMYIKPQVRQVLSKCLFVAARESISAKVLEGIIRRPVPVFPDMGYFLKSSESQVGERLCLDFNVPLKQRPCVAITVRPYRFPEITDPQLAFTRYLDAMCELVVYIVTKGFYPVFVTHVAGPSAHEDDRLAIREIVDRLEKDIQYSWIDFSGDCRDIKAVYGCMDYLIGTRFHSVIFAQDMGVPCLAIAYGGNKSTGIMDDMGLGNYVVPIDQVSGALLCRKFDLLVDNRLEIKAKMRLWCEDAVSRRKIMLDTIASLFTNATGKTGHH